jgi:hypothetical protein
MSIILVSFFSIASPASGEQNENKGFNKAGP